MHKSTEQEIEALLARMTLDEKIGQMRQVQGTGEVQAALVRQGAVGSLINVVGEETQEYQRIAVQESRLGIPLLFGRDVIHGFRTIFPIPLGQAASFDPAGVRDAARIAAVEASAAGVNWTFAPMLDIARDPRWGRIAESLGEDPHLAARLGVAMVEGFQGSGRLDEPSAIAACAKHFVGYGAAEGGRDYDTTWIPEPLLRDIYLAPFKAAVAAGVATVMTGFNDLNGVPASGHAWALRGVLRGEWAFDGMVVSDWNSIIEMITHGHAADTADAAAKGVLAGVDMEMASSSYADHLGALLASGQVAMPLIDEAVRRILRLKLRLGLFTGRSQALQALPPSRLDEHRQRARELARESCVLLKNDRVLPIPHDIGCVAVVGPLADSRSDALGCWTFDAQSDDTQTVLQALRQRLGDDRVLHANGLDHCRATDQSGFEQALEVGRRADLIIACLGEDAGLSGESHSRAFLDLPGAQQQLLDQLVATGTPLVAVVFAGRPLTLQPVVDAAWAVLLAWHPGTMGGPALVDLLFGDEAPSGRLPVSLPRSVGQLPIYYNRKNTGRPPNSDAPSLPTGTPLDPSGFSASYLDVDHRPLFPFGFGLSYTHFAYSGLHLSTTLLEPGATLVATVTLRNTGHHQGVEVVQLYVRDLVASLVRPVRELKGFQRVALEPDEQREVSFSLAAEDLAFHDAAGLRITEPGTFRLWIGPDAAHGIEASFELQPVGATRP
jgi:beta-glucosidase